MQVVNSSNNSESDDQTNDNFTIKLQQNGLKILAPNMVSIHCLSLVENNKCNIFEYQVFICSLAQTRYTCFQ